MARRIKTLFVCTGNACRSQIAEALLRHLGGDRFEVFSAGSHPAGYVHPLAIHALKAIGVPFSNGRSKSWHEFADAELDVIITVCIAAAHEACPNWQGAPVTVNWPLPDPVTFEGTGDQAETFAVLVAKRLKAKLERFIALDFAGTPPDQLRQQVAGIADV